ncbi:MAG: hypothetical protein K2L42_07000 [Clostridia bacterium]|nr:hypothetical protein [Clostridia bacterium]
MANDKRHMFSTQTDGAKYELNYKIDDLGILLDLKFLLGEYYAATFSPEGNALCLSFTNGQKFRISVTEV